eukprot:gene19461-29990_t
MLFKKVRSGLFAPASNAKVLAKAMSGVTQADFVVIDLEDSVHPDDKGTARQAALSAVRAIDVHSPIRNVVVRVNSLRTKAGQADFELLRNEGVPLLFPKVEVPNDIPTQVREKQMIWAMIETATGVMNAAGVAEAVGALVAGTQDLGADLRLPKPVPLDRAPFLYALGAIVCAARAGNALCFDSVCASFKDLEPVEAEARQAAAHGFDGKTCIHPAQVPAVNAAFSPSADAVERARAIVAAWAAAARTHPGIVTISGTMVEELHVRDAQRILSSI